MIGIEQNLEAIALLKTLQARNRKPTETEKITLSKFNGWRALWQVFRPEHTDHAQLKSLLTPKEYTQPNAIILHAYKTHPEIVKAILFIKLVSR